MKIINAGYEILRPNPLDGIAELKHLELCARTAYKSEDKITEDGESAKRMIKRLIESGHESTLEHGGMTVKFTVDRGVSHEIVRHRLASYTQESTRYCNYSKDKFGKEITVIEPCFLSSNTPSDGGVDMDEYQKWHAWHEGCKFAENEWRWFLRLRGASDAHPQIQEVARPLLNELHEKIPVLFDDIWEAIHV